MPAPSQRALSGLAVAAAATLVAGIVSAFSVGSGSGSSTASSTSPTTIAGVSSATTETLAPGQTVGPSATPTTTASVGKPGAPTTTVAPLPAASGPVGDPGQPTATKPGTYHYTYAFSGDGSEAPTTGPMTKQITTTSASGGTTRQSEVDQGPDTRATRNVSVEWRPQGLYEIKELINFNSQSASCTWSPSLLEGPVGLAAGKSWPIQGSCQFSVYGQPITLHLTGSGKVTGKERLVVGSQPVDVWDIAVNYTMTASNAGFGTYTITFNGLDRFAARLGLVVEEDADTSVSSASSGTHKGHIHEAAQSLTPS